MTTFDPGDTHEVTNQPPLLADYDLFSTDLPLSSGLAREGGGFGSERVLAFGRVLGSRETLELGRVANRETPELRTHDRYGHRIDEVEFHPAWHAMMSLAIEHGVHALPWREPVRGAHVARSAMLSMLSQVESGSCCPITMTFACVPSLRVDAAIAAEWEPRVLGTAYDRRFVPASEKRTALVGMAMTEKQGGSDVRANTTRARPLGASGSGAEYELEGHKWFCSAPMSDAFLTLAQTDRGLSCFLVPRFRPDGTRNPFRLQRLKDKLGNRSNASSEVEYRGTWARMLGKDGRGVRTIIEMVHHTRLDCVTGSAGILRQALVQAAHHASHRMVFGRRLADQPLMRNVLADLALESEAATALMLRLARAYDDSAADEAERLFARIATAVAKYWVCKRTPHAVYEAMECLGGNGYVEESPMPRLYREAPVNAIWEGSGNVICLDVLRAVVREPNSLPALFEEFRRARGGDARLDRFVDALERDLRDPADAETRARMLVERLALALSASLLVRDAPSGVADAFCGSRLAGAGGLSFGTLPRGSAFGEILARAWPGLA